MSGFMEVLTQDTLVTSILMGLIALVGLVANALMLRAVVQYPRLRTDFYVVFGYLSVVDSLFLIISVPASIMDMMYASNENTEAWCKGSAYLISTCGVIAAYLIVVLAVLRGILLTNRNTIRRPQAYHLVIVCGVVCGITLLCCIPVMFMFTSLEGMCYFVDPLNEASRFTWLMTSFSEFVPIVFIMVIYCMTYLLGKRYFSDSYSPREKEKSRLVSSIIIAFIICQTPYRIAAIYDLYVDPNDEIMFNRMYIIKNYLMCLLMADKAVRPILYTKLTSDLCEAFDEVINCVYCSSHYSLTHRFGRPVSAYTTPTNPKVLSTLISSADNNLGRTTERTVSSSSAESATSQTPLVRKSVEDEAMTICVE
ncbi:unnamed protein product [Candidula unifasciata]|uniref:G-protein coupled receptors family 1 profile domain-containing protein n=1 Tax=Candidula unifasciata TaxID=100452 RepID=A0A8S3ZNT8_9EUPU|nr:unnamed protein product [Candidula unifasciata]